MRIDAT